MYLYILYILAGRVSCAEFHSSSVSFSPCTLQKNCWNVFHTKRKGMRCYTAVRAVHVCLRMAVASCFNQTLTSAGFPPECRVCSCLCQLQGSHWENGMVEGGGEELHNGLHCIAYCHVLGRNVLAASQRPIVFMSLLRNMPLIRKSRPIHRVMWKNVQREPWAK